MELTADSVEYHAGLPDGQAAGSHRNGEHDMAAVTAGPARPGPVPADGHRAGVAGTLRSELTKIRSVRSTYWTLFLLVVAGIAWSIAFCAGEASRWPTMTAPGQGRLRPDAVERRRGWPCSASS